MVTIRHVEGVNSSIDFSLELLQHRVQVPAAWALGEGRAGSSELLQPLCSVQSGSRDPAGRLLQAYRSSLRWESPGIPTPPAP